ncbi:hypothetical protein [uncultured Desulfovibrio sp.]|uniref:hypothetical protein n=1 Tax=uncultured Desulfovibrio sp. TaxID=167968 RepID=UPI0026098177|nr:hypothetical protein [uncultured Desulfovibrio sp.]
MPGSDFEDIKFGCFSCRYCHAVKNGGKQTTLGDGCEFLEDESDTLEDLERKLSIEIKTRSVLEKKIDRLCVEKTTLALALAGNCEDKESCSTYKTETLLNQEHLNCINCIFKRFFDS